MLLVAEKDAEAAKNHVTAMTEAIEVETVLIDWKRDAQNLKYYEHLMERFKDYDISFLVLPKL